MEILAIRNQSETKGFMNYDVSNLLEKIDSILIEYGFAGDNIMEDPETHAFCRDYHGFKGEIKVRFVKNNFQVIPLIINDKKLICPIYVQRDGIPESIDQKLLEELIKI